MTRSPLFATLLPLIPLAALGWPLAAVIQQEGYVFTPPPEAATSPLASADLFIRAAHPFSTAEVRIGETRWTLTPDDEVVEITYPKEDQIDLVIRVVWPEGTPESAALIELQPELGETFTHTIWGFGEASEEVSFRPKDDE